MSRIIRRTITITIRMAADWVKGNIASLFAGSPEITAGAVIVLKTVVVRSE